jgi:kexin
VGDWTIKVSDQGKKDNTGKFLGWTMTLFGSCIDAGAAVPYTLSVVTASPGNPLPPHPPTGTKPKTKVHPKPTDHLPPSHGETPGENDKPAFNNTQGAEDALASATPDEGYFPGMTRLLKNSTWLVFAMGAVVIFGIGATIYFWRRGKRLQQSIGSYEPVAAGEDVPMMNTAGRPSTGWNSQRGTKELYDAFGEVSDDEADEETGLRRPMESADLRFHSGFLEDDDPQSATHHTTPYRDNPKPEEREKMTSPGSNDDSSWEHASQQQEK